MIKETVTVQDVRELKKAVKKKYDTIILEGAVKKDMLKNIDSFKLKNTGKLLSNFTLSMGLFGTAVFGIGIPFLVGGLIGSAIFKDGIRSYDLSYDDEANTLKLLYSK